MAKKIGLGIVLAYESTTPGTYTTVGELIDFTAPDLTVETVDVTDHSHTDGVRRKIAALAEYGSATATIAFDPALTVFSAIETIQLARAVRNWRFTFPTASGNETFPMIVTGLSRATPMDDKMTCDVTLEAAGPRAT